MNHSIKTSSILESTAEVERVWFIAMYNLSDNNQSMDPFLFEALLPMKVNSTYWNLKPVQEAICQGAGPEEDFKLALV